MTKEQIDKAFEGRWRIKGNIAQGVNPNSPTMFDEFYDYVKNLCRDFFEAGICLGEGANCPPIPLSAIVDADIEANGFSIWWEMYGKKIDRGKCEKKWAKLSLEEKQACIAATPAYVASTPDLQYRRHPMTYLNNKSWENQIIPHNNGTKQPTIEQQRRDKLASILTD